MQYEALLVQEREQSARAVQELKEWHQGMDAICKALDLRKGSPTGDMLDRVTQLSQKAQKAQGALQSSYTDVGSVSLDALADESRPHPDTLPESIRGTERNADEWKALKNEVRRLLGEIAGQRKHAEAEREQLRATIVQRTNERNASNALLERERALHEQECVRREEAERDRDEGRADLRKIYDAHGIHSGRTITDVVWFIDLLKNKRKQLEVELKTAANERTNDSKYEGLLDQLRAEIFQRTSERDASNALLDQERAHRREADRDCEGARHALHAAYEALGIRKDSTTSDAIASITTLHRKARQRLPEEHAKAFNEAFDELSAKLSRQDERVRSATQAIVQVVGAYGPLDLEGGY